MIKRKISLLLLILFMFNISVIASTQSKNKVKIDGKDTKIEAVVISNQNYIQAKQLDLYLKTTTSYESKTKTVIIKQKNKTIKFQIGKHGSKIINGRTMIPVGRTRIL